MQSCEPSAMGESTVVYKPLLDTIVVKDSQGDGCFPNSTSTNKSDRSKAIIQQGDYANLRLRLREVRDH